MDTNLEHYLNMMFVFIVFGLMFFLWIWLDNKEARENGYQMKSKHYHHVLLGLWPVLTTLLLVLLYDHLSYLAVSVFILCTGLLYFFSGLWDVRDELLNVNSQRLLKISTPLSRVARMASISAIVMGILGTSAGLAFTVIEVTYPSVDQGRIRLLIALVSIIILGLITSRAIRAWNIKAGKRRGNASASDQL